eukprot:6367728-Pyramimonas_sp.AAC.1
MGRREKPCPGCVRRSSPSRLGAARRGGGREPWTGFERIFAGGPKRTSFFRAAPSRGDEGGPWRPESLERRSSRLEVHTST